MKHTDLLGFNQDIDIDNLLKEASCRQKSQELADSYSTEELQDRLDQIMRDMEQEAEPEGGPIADMYADEMDAYEGALRIAKGGSDTPLTYDQAIGRVSRDDFEKSSKFDRGIGEGQKIGKTSYKTRTAINTAPGKTEDKEVMIDNTDDLNNVTIRWRGANHHGNKTLTNLKFTKESEFDEDLLAFSNDSKWLFIVDLDEETGEPDWDTLMVNNRELEHVDDDGNSTYKVPDEDMVEQGLNRMNRDMTPEEEYLMNNPSPGTSTPLNTQSGEFNVNVPVQNEMESVNIKYGHATGPLDDVTISWGEESHNVDFEEGDVIDDHGNEGKDMTFVAYSQDDMWRFIVDVSVGFNYENSGEIQDVMWDTLEIAIDDAKMDPAVRSDFDDPIMERFQQLAGLKPLYEQLGPRMRNPRPTGPSEPGSFDSRLAQQMGMSDDEFEDQVASRDIGDGGSSFPGDESGYSPAAAKARDYIETFRKEYREMSDDQLDEFSVEIINHLLDNTAAQAAAKVYFGKRGL